MFDARRCNRLAAFSAITEFVAIYRAQGEFCLGDFRTAPSVCRLRHCLLLKRIHPAEAPDGLLVECYNLALLSRSGRVGFQPGDAALQPGAEILELLV